MVKESDDAIVGAVSCSLLLLSLVLYSNIGRGGRVVSEGRSVG